MTVVTAQTIVVFVGGLVLVGASTSLTRRGLLSLRYGLGWMVVSLGVVLAALLLWVVAPLASALSMTPTGLMLAAATSALLALTLQLSVSLSLLQRAVRDLSEANALLESRLHAAETAIEVHPVLGAGLRRTGLDATRN